MAKPEWGIEIPGGFFDEGKHIYRDETGIRILSTTQVFTVLGLSDFSQVPPDILEWKRIYGTALHRAAELLLQGHLDWDSVDDVLIPAVTGIDNWLQSIGYVAESTEEIMIGAVSGMKVGMTRDTRGEMNFRRQRKKAVIDFKTGVEVSPTWNWQLGAYAPPGVMGIVAQVSKAGKVTPHYVEDTMRYKREFGTLLAAANIIRAAA